MIYISDGANVLIKRLNDEGFSAYVVGGCVRDALMGRMQSDWDITTSACPSEMEHVFFDLRIIPTGINHGTITVIYNDTPYEITTFRTDGEYRDHRRPECVEFSTNLVSDLARRDFTINALAYHPREGLVDIFGGVEDIKRKMIRCVRDPYQRFNEDALRILRALRFSSQLAFQLEDTTERACFECAPLIQHLAYERVSSELCRLICGIWAKPVLLQYRTILNGIIPQDTMLSGLDKLPCDLIVRLAYVFREEPNMLHALRMPRKQLARILKIIQCDMHDIRHIFGALGEEDTRRILAFRYALGQNTSQQISELNEAILKKECCKVQDLAVNGHDLLSNGIPKGRIIGVLLEKLLERVMAGEIVNEREALLKHAFDIYRPM